ncbi:MAG TPA: hypothetical protein VK666_02365, partial [Chryseolinea sp.]|nr:hypothetical protein [Chryseolinea sp.]
MRKIFSLIKQNVVYASIFLMIALIVLTTIFAFRNQSVMKQTNTRISDANVVLRNVKELWT